MTDHMRDIGDAESEFDDSATSVIPASDEWDDEAPADDSPHRPVAGRRTYGAERSI
ncbi:hypothetical protein NIIDMKKI_19340 [Mycobacterium kansasii]|uniref:Uncharacterized protein n=1 Tax=Mycobacterium kansasii TaxID=1768 RepID=A0A1V3XIF6_MYCKA|nr:hypothetical protein BZL30_2005 [Mycobacterium kansasii]BCI86728.1 hypothetical protein NIIDMKKI_19340 [Mycobacterium kansasii]